MWNGAGGIGFPGETFHNTNTGLRGHTLLSQTHPGAACGQEESNAGAAPIQEGRLEIGAVRSFIYYLNIGKLKDALARVPELWDSFSDAVNSIPSIPSCVKERVCRIGIAAQAKIPSGAGIKE